MGKPGIYIFYIFIYIYIYIKPEQEQIIYFIRHISSHTILPSHGKRNFPSLQFFAVHPNSIRPFWRDTGTKVLIPPQHLPGVSAAGDVCTRTRKARSANPKAQQGRELPSERPRRERGWPGQEWGWPGWGGKGGSGGGPRPMALALVSLLPRS